MVDDNYLETHRFNINQISGERLHKLQNFLEGFRIDHPEVAGLVVYGSSVFGKAKPESDIDGVLFLDSRKFSGFFQMARKVTDAFGFSDWEKIDPEVGKEFRNGLQECANLTEYQVGDIKIRLISPGRVARELEEIILYEKQRQKRMKSGRYYSGDDDRPRSCLHYLFYMEIGFGLKEYRRQIIERLGSEDIGDQVWVDYFVNGIQFGENLRLRGVHRSHLLPNTVEKAREYFKI